MQELQRFFDEAWAQPAIRFAMIVVASFIIAKLGQIFGTRILLRLASRTRTDVDDLLIGQLRRPVFVTVFSIGLYLAIHSTDWHSRWIDLSVSIVHTLLVIVWLTHGMRLISITLDGLSRLANRVSWIEVRTLPLLDNVAKLVLFGGAVYCLLKAWRLDVTPWLASAGVVGIAIGFAAKDSLANLFGGIFVIMDSPYKIGDYINLDSGERGQVVKIGLRSTRLLTRDDVEITVPNAAIANAKVVNESGGPWERRRVKILVGVAYGSDVAQVKEILQRSVESVPEIVDDPEPRVRFHEMGDSALIFRVLGWIEQPELLGRAIDGLNTAVYNNLNAAKVQIPFPQRDVHLYRTDLDG